MSTDLSLKDPAQPGADRRPIAAGGGAVAPRRARKVALAASGAAALLIAGVTSVVVASDSGDSGSPSASASASAPLPDNGNLVVVHSLERYATETAQDWVTNAQRVVVIRPVREAAAKPSATDAARGEGLIGRTLTVRIEKTLWSADGAPALPAVLSFKTAGWVFSDGVANRARLAMEGSSRLELGHRYVVALRWWGAMCEDAKVTPAHWEPLGSGAVLPYDTARLGYGEVEGATQTIANRPARSVANLSLNRPVGELTTMLERATPGQAPVEPAVTACTG